MDTNDTLLNKELRRDEDVRYVPYADTVGVQTVGVGHNLKVSPLPAGWKYPLNDAQVDALLTVDLERTFAALDKQLSWWRGLSYARQRVMANMTFNMGIDGLLTFKNTLSFVRVGDYPSAATNMLQSKWASQVHGRATRLAKMMIDG